MLVSFIALALAASSTLAHNPLTPRKSLSFGPVHPHAKFTVEPAALPPSLRSTSGDPIEIARRFANEVILPSEDARRHSYVVREDSYTDSTTGVTHVYLRQLINGIEVADGNININVLDGNVISYGDSVSGSPHCCHSIQSG
jgi:extracellular elastinolytic metalloproteinase